MRQKEFLIITFFKRLMTMTIKEETLTIKYKLLENIIETAFNAGYENAIMFLNFNNKSTHNYGQKFAEKMIKKIVEKHDD